MSADNVNIKPLIGIIVGVVSIVFSTFCLVIMPVFTGAIIAAALLGAVSGAIAWALRARRAAVVIFTFVFAPLIAAIAVAALALVNYSRTKRAAPEIAT